MAVKQKLEVVPLLPNDKNQLEDAIAKSLANEINQLIEGIDFRKVGALTAKHLGELFKQKVIDWAKSDKSAYVPTNEVEAIAMSDEVAA